jgi:hypothetical protein
MKKCPACNRSYDDLQSFCLEDGTLLIADSPAVSESSITVPKKKSRLPLIFGAFILIIGVSAAAWFLLAPKEQSANQANRQLAVNSPTPLSTPTATPAETPTPTPTATPLPETNTNTAATNADANIKPASDANTSKPLPTLMKAEEHQVVFNLQQCRKSGTSITCDLTLTNAGQDRRFRLSTYRSKLFDELGNGYRGEDAQVANQTGDSPEIGFINGVTTKAQMTFENIEPNAAKITLLEFSFAVGDDYDLSVKFRNVPLTAGR